MNFQNLSKMMVITLLLMPSLIIAEEAIKEKKVEINLKGKIFMDWTGQMESKEDGVKQDDAYNKFNLNRVYLTWKKKLDSIFSIRVTTDVLATEKTDEGGTDDHSHNPKHSKYDAYLKYAYLQGKKKIGDVEVKAMAGLTKTSSIGFIDDKLTGTRWINKNFIDGSKTLIGTSIDHSADLGLNLNLNYNKLVELNFSYMNGEGYKDVDVTTDDQGKQLGARLSIMPVKGLFINGYYSDTDKSEQDSTGDNFIRYYGGGIAWNNDLIKVGLNYLIIDSCEDDVDQGDIWLADSWLKIDFGKIVDMPVFLYGRYAIGENKDVENSKITYTGVGVGYNYSKNLQLIAYYNQEVVDTVKDTCGKEIQVKAEVKF